MLTRTGSAVVPEALEMLKRTMGTRSLGQRFILKWRPCSTVYLMGWCDRPSPSWLVCVWVQNADIVIEFEYYCIMLPFTSCQRPVVLKASTAMLSSFARILCTAAHTLLFRYSLKLTILLTGCVCAPWFVPGNDVGNFCYTCKLARPYFHCVSELTLANATALPR